MERHYVFETYQGPNCQHEIEIDDGQPNELSRKREHEWSEAIGYGYTLFRWRLKFDSGWRYDPHLSPPWLKFFSASQLLLQTSLRD
jgi:hypothetical protein